MKKIALATLATLALTSSAYASTPAKGDLIGDIGIGVGAMDGGNSVAAFTQRLAVEYGIANFSMLNSDWTATIGYQINNGVHTSSHTVSEVWTGTSTKFTNTSDDITFMPTASIHHGFTDRIDGFATLGLGFGLLNGKRRGGGYSNSWTEASFAMAFNIGGRYWLSDNLAVNAQFGLVSASWKNSYGSYNILSAGISYKF